jgi:hypothetical protein
MTHTSATQKRRKRRVAQRARAVPFQVMLSPDERDSLQRQAAAEGCSASDVVRGWIVVYAPRARRPAVDPRQITLMQVLEGAT